jgi:adenosylhomocysteine nucleosidase
VPRQRAPGRVRILTRTLGFVVGLAAEARIAARFGCPVRVGGGTPAGAAEAATRLIGEGATALVSFGLAGGLDPALRPGAIIIPATVISDDRSRQADGTLADRFGGFSGHIVLAGAAVAADAASKRCLYATTRADAIDLESGAVARVAESYGLPFVVVRVICDPAERDLPQAALVALDPKGGIGLLPVVWSVLRRPKQIPDLLRLGRDAALARRALRRLTTRFHDGGS